MAYYDSVLFIVKVGIAGMVFLGVIFFVLKPLMKNLSEGFKTTDIPSMPSRRRFENREDEELEIPTSESKGATNESIIKMARSDPLKTTQLVRNWLRDKK